MQHRIEIIASDDDMTKSEMEQMITLRKEIMKIASEMKKPRESKVVVFYKDYKRGYAIPKSVQETDSGEEQLRILRGSLRAYQRQLRELLIRAEGFIDSIDDSRMRTILRMYYINGSSQCEIAKELGLAQCVISKKIQDFWRFHHGREAADAHQP